MSVSGGSLTHLEETTTAWQRQIDLEARIARTRGDLPLLDAEARRTRDPRHVSNLGAARAHLARLEQERASLGDAAARYEAAAAAREGELRTNRYAPHIRLTEIAGQRGQLHALLRELREALDAGRAAEAALAEARNTLELIWRISSADSVFSYSALIDVDKYLRIRRSNEMLAWANAALHAFARELTDVGVAAALPPLPPLDISGPVAALDALNTLGVESYVMLRASRATTQATHALTAVRQHLWSLDQRRAAHETQVHALGVERHDLLRAALEGPRAP